RAARARRLRSIRTQDTSQVAQQPEGEDPEKKQPDRARAEDPGRLAGQGPRGFPAQVRQRSHGQRVELETGAQVAVQELVQRAQRAAARARKAGQRAQRAGWEQARGGGIVKVHEDREQDECSAGGGLPAAVGHRTLSMLRPIPRANITTQKNPGARPRPNPTQLQILACREAASAPAWSPIVSLLETWAANTIATTPGGRQQNSVARMAGAR